LRARRLTRHSQLRHNTSVSFTIRMRMQTCEGIDYISQQKIKQKKKKKKKKKRKKERENLAIWTWSLPKTLNYGTHYFLFPTRKGYNRNHPLTKFWVGVNFPELIKNLQLVVLGTRSFPLHQMPQKLPNLWTKHHC